MRRSVRFAKSSRPKRYRPSWPILLAIVLLWSVCMGGLLAHATGASLAAFPPNQASQVAAIPLNRTVDPIPQKYQLGAELYLQNCATCHIGLPPEVLPSETWRQLLLEPAMHYGETLPRIQKLQKQLIWQYLRAFSRPLKQGETIPFRMERSRFFNALHPDVRFSQSVRPNTCAVCHPGASNYDFRSLTPEWEATS